MSEATERTPAAGSAARVSQPVRRADADDARAAAAVEQLVRDAGLPTAGLADMWAAFVIESDGRLVAVAGLERHGPAGGPVFLLRSVAVDAASRGRGLVAAAMVAADAEVGGVATVGLLTEIAEGYFDRFGFAPVDRADLPAALAGSTELTGARPESARPYLRR